MGISEVLLSITSPFSPIFKVFGDLKEGKLSNAVQDTLNGVNRASVLAADTANTIKSLKDNTVSAFDDTSKTKVSQFHYMKDTLLDNKLGDSSVFGKVLRSQDKTMLDTFGKKLFGDALTFTEDGAAYIEGSATKKMAASSLAGIPRLSVALSAVPELFALNNARKNGDLPKQAAKSSINVVGASIGSGIGRALVMGAMLSNPVTAPFAVLPGSYVGAFVGGVAGYFIADKLGKHIFGESIQDTINKNEKIHTESEQIQDKTEELK